MNNTTLKSPTTNKPTATPTQPAAKTAGTCCSTGPSCKPHAGHHKSCKH